MTTLDRRRASKFVSFSAATGLAFAMLVGASPAQAAEACEHANVWLNSWNVTTGVGALNEYSVDETTGALVLERTSTLTEAYGDIALSADEQTMYGVDFADWGSNSELIQLDPSNGAVVSRTGISPLVSSTNEQVSGLNSLSFAPDGSLYVSSSVTSDLFVVDPATGTWSQPNPATFPNLDPDTRLYAAGDFLTLPDGDVLAVLTNQDLANGPWAFLARMNFDTNTSAIVAKVNKQIFGAAQSGGKVFLASENGDVYSLDQIPVTGDANNDITDQLFTALGGDGVNSWWGATSSQDSGCEIPPVDPVDPVVPDPVKPGKPADVPAVTTPKAPVRVETGAL